MSPIKEQVLHLMIYSGGYVTMSFMTYSGAIQQINAGTLRPIAIAGQSRYKGLPDVPTVIESGIKDFTDISSWNGLFVDMPLGIWLFVHFWQGLVFFLHSLQIYQ